MKKQWFVGLAAILAMGCFAGCDTKTNGSSNSLTSSSGTATVNTQVTEEEWKAAWEFDTPQGICVECNVTTPDDERVMTIGKMKGNTLYYDLEFSSQKTSYRETYYCIFNDTSFSFVQYYYSVFYDASYPYVPTWRKRESNLEENEYKESKSQTIIEGLFQCEYQEGMLYSVNEGEETLYIGELYSAFTYNETDKSYSATLYREARRSCMLIVKFENRKIAQWKTEQGESDDVSIPVVFNFTYDIEDIIIPQETLNAIEL